MNIYRSFEIINHAIFLNIKTNKFSKQSYFDILDIYLVRKVKMKQNMNFVK